MSISSHSGSISIRKVLFICILAIVLVATGGFAGAGWYYSDMLRDRALVVDHTPPQRDLEVTAIGEGKVTLRASSKAEGDWMQEGIWGLEWDGGYAQVGKILKVNDREVIRELLPSKGNPKIGSIVRLDSFAFTGDPLTALNIPYEEITFSSQPGKFPAWLVDGSRDTWVIFVHGRSANRREALRMLPTVVRLGFASLIITYRNDEESPASPDGYYHFGETEWQDLEAAANYAVEHGAKRLILVGYSMGGAIVTNFLYESPMAKHVAGVILDSPVLNFGAVVDFGARRAGYPVLLTWEGKTIAGFRFGIDWKSLDYLSRANKLAVPILLFHGRADDQVPFETSDALAKARPDIVNFVRSAEANHVRSWNMNSAAYETAVYNFLQKLTQLP